ncbi:hypothetical protein WOLCODRAFT_109456, partial [Wolfiporia cocos MD-104 SS10]
MCSIYQMKCFRRTLVTVVVSLTGKANVWTVPARTDDPVLHCHKRQSQSVVNQYGTFLPRFSDSCGGITGDFEAPHIFASQGVLCRRQPQEVLWAVIVMVCLSLGQTDKTPLSANLTNFHCVSHY